ncbi:MAG: alpha/beta fold hydrolase [Alphaproteobacteria bacterium]|nr:alpha/beta fold hydrolase [Alphaproteobacteria bacterium]
MNYFAGKPKHYVHAKTAHSVQDSKSAESKDVGLVLQGGGALGAYEAGAVIRLLEAGYRPAVLAGTSIGAINACAIAAPLNTTPQHNLLNLWKHLRNDPPMFFPKSQMQMFQSLGHPRFFSMRQDFWNSKGWQSLYSIEPALETMRKFIDFDFLNSDACATVVMTATNVETGEIERFSNRTHTLRPEHLMASGALPPSFPPIEVDGQYYWDGGLYDNTPIQSLIRILDEHQVEAMPIFLIEVFSAKGAVPNNINESLDRMTELVYEDKFWKMFEGSHQAAGYAEMLIKLDEMVGPENPLRENPHYSQLMHLRAIAHVFTIHAEHAPLSGVTDFSSESVGSRMQAGFSSTSKFLDEQEGAVEALLEKGRQLDAADEAAAASLAQAAESVIDDTAGFESTAFTPKSFITSDHMRLSYREYGADKTDGPILMALPGLTRNIRDLDPMAAIMGETNRVYTLNLRGRDTSEYDKDFGNYTTPVYIRDIYEFWQHLDCKPVVLMGSSLGALLAMLMVEDHPDMLSGIILNDLGATIEAEGMARIFGYAGKLADETDIDNVVATLKEHVGNQFSDLSDHEWERMARSMYGLKDGFWHHRYDDNLGRAIAENPETPRDLWECHKKAAEMDLPILSIRGVLSDVTSKETVEKMMEMAPTMSAAEIENRGHCPLLNEPASIEALNKFLATIK